MAAKTAAANKVAPLSDRVVVKAIEETEQMRGGLYIPDTAKEKPQQGEVIAVGPGRTEDGKQRRNSISTSMRARRSSAASISSPRR